MDVDDRHFLWTLLENFSPLRARLGPAWPEFRAQLAENLDALEVAPDDESYREILRSLARLVTERVAGNRPTDEAGWELDDDVESCGYRIGPASPDSRDLGEAIRTDAAGHPLEIGLVRTGGGRPVPAHQEDFAFTVNRSATHDLLHDLTERLNDEDAGLVRANGGSRRVAANGGAHPPRSIGGGVTATGGEAGDGHTVEATAVRTAYAKLDCPEFATVGEEFEIAVGLASTPDPNVDARPFELPADLTARVLVVDLDADGFDLREGEQPRQYLSLSNEAFPRPAVWHLTPVQQRGKKKSREISVIYHLDGQLLGIATRGILVRKHAEVDAPPSRAAYRGSDVAVPAADAATDLAVVISLRDDKAGSLYWRLYSPHIPEDEFTVEIGESPEDFLDALVRTFSKDMVPAAAADELLGVAKRVRSVIPVTFWDALRAVATKVAAEEPGRRPAVLLVSQEPYVPWELASMAPDLLDPAAPPFLGAQVDVGRWLFKQASPARGQRPTYPPPVSLQVGTMVVVAGDYRTTDDNDTWTTLKEAKREAADLKKTFGAERVKQIKPERVQVRACLHGDPTAEALHFSMHGSYDPSPGAAWNGLILADGDVYTPQQIAARDLANAPFVFLNACQVGAGYQSLGTPAGMATTFLEVGASAVVAPLWAVRDSVAREVATTFYRRVLDEGATPAQALREQRARFSDTHEFPATVVAYQFFGHPRMALSWR